jgi:hypothetical protein
VYRLLKIVYFKVSFILQCYRFMYFFLWRHDKHRLKIKIIWECHTMPLGKCHTMPLGKYLQTFWSIAAPNAFVSVVKPFLGWLALKMKALGYIILRNFSKYWKSVTTYPHINTNEKTSHISNIEVHCLLNLSYVPNPFQRNFCRRYVSNLRTNTLSYFYNLLCAATVSVPVSNSTFPSPIYHQNKSKFFARRKMFLNVTRVLF